MEYLPDILVKAYGPYGLAALAVVGALILYRKEIRGYLKKRITPATPKGIELLQLAVCQRERKRRRVKIVDCRKKMIADLVKIRYKIFESQLKDVGRWDFTRIKQIQLHGTLQSIVDTALKEADERAREEGIHPAVIALFRHETQLQAEIFMSAIRAVCESPQFATNIERMDTIFRILAEVITDARMIIDDQLAEFEEELHGFKYKGFVCGKVENDESSS